MNEAIVFVTLSSVKGKEVESPHDMESPGFFQSSDSRPQNHPPRERVRVVCVCDFTGSWLGAQASYVRTLIPLSYVARRSRLQTTSGTRVFLPRLKQGDRYEPREVDPTAPRCRSVTRSPVVHVPVAGPRLVTGPLGQGGPEGALRHTPTPAPGTEIPMDVTHEKPSTEGW